RRAAGCGGVGQAAAYLEVEPVDLIAIDMAVGAQQVAIIDTSAGKGPVLGPVDRKAAHAARRATAPTGIDPARRIEPEGRRTRPADFRRFPGVGGAGDITAAIDGILGARAIFVA